MIYRIIFLSGPRTGERVTVTEQPMCVGRDPECVVHAPDNEMALRHAEVFQKGDELFIRDLGSMNKILVNKREVHESRLKHGDEFELGRTRFVVQALVQAEVNGRRAPRRRRAAAWAIAASMMLVLGLALSARYVPRDPDAPVETSGLQPPPTNPAVVTRSTPPVPPALTEDLRLLREDLRAIQDTVRTLNPPTPPPPAVLPTLTPPPAPRTPKEEAAELIGAAREAIAGGHFTEADRLLAHIQYIAPDFLPAYEERARLFEKQGRTGEAAAQWSEVLRRSTESPIYQKAVAERIRLSQAVAQQTQPADAPVRIASIQPTRFPAGEDFDEMRVLKIILATEPDQRLDPDRVRVEALFYDRDRVSGDVAPTAGRVTVQPIDAAAVNSAGEYLLTATYVIPKGLRAEQAAAGAERVYHGYHVRVLRGDVTVDERAQPNALAALAPPALADSRRAETPAAP